MRSRADNPRVRCVRSRYPNGFGFAVRAGLDVFEGDAVAIVMGDGSDGPSDLLRYFDLIERGLRLRVRLALPRREPGDWLPPLSSWSTAW